jgi:Rrf2 family iron-sulfur cluster assembly transcriptional regulator
MKLSTKGRYAVMAVCDLATNSDGQPLSLAEIAGRQDISLSYLEQLFAKLRRAGVVKSIRGPGGGYMPARALHEITIASIVAAVDQVDDAESEDAAPGAAHSAMPSNVTQLHNQKPVTHDLWEQLGNQVRWFLNRVSVADVLKGEVPGAVGKAANDEPPGTADRSRLIPPGALAPLPGRKPAGAVTNPAIDNPWAAVRHPRF